MDLPKRKPTRLTGYDYSTSGVYFVTIRTQNRERLFEIQNVGNDLCVVPPSKNAIIRKWLKEYIDTNPLKWESDCFYNDERSQQNCCDLLMSFKAHLI